MTLPEELRQAIAADGRPLNQISAAAGLADGQLSRFMRGERTLTVDTVTKLLRALRLDVRLVPATRPRKGW